MGCTICKSPLDKPSPTLGDTKSSADRGDHIARQDEPKHSINEMGSFAAVSPSTSQPPNASGSRRSVSSGTGPTTGRPPTEGRSDAVSGARNTSLNKQAQNTNSGNEVESTPGTGPRNYSSTPTVPRWSACAGTPIGPGALRVAARPTILTSRVRRETTIFDTYKLSNCILGTGISGAVRVATNRFSGQKFAIKTLSLQNVPPKKAAMLHNEVTIYLKLDHPNIVKLIEVYEEEKAIHLVMELCNGGELYDRLALKKRYSEADAARVAVQMLDAINYCHYHRICHRDLKLENWVYAGPNEYDPLKLIDFGFSRIYNPGIPMTAMHGTVYYVSPEVMDGCYKEKCDIWSVGVIIYMLLSGSPPFNGSHDHEILIKIKKGEFSFPWSRWSGVSDEAKDFICTLLIKDADKRASAAEALKHPWLTLLNTHEDHELNIGVLTQMRMFALANVMKRAALGIVALSMTPQEAREVEKQFKILDKNQSGTIQLQELASVLLEKLNLSQEESNRIFARLDQTGDHEVHYSEFMASTLGVKFLKDEQLVREAFRKFDVQRNGYITVENLRQVLGDTYTGTKVEDIVKYCDHKGNNVIDYEEFLAAMSSDDMNTFGESPLDNG